MTNLHCAMIHGGLNIDLKKSTQDVHFSHCCQRLETDILDPNENIWTSKKLIPLRELNKQNEWGADCKLCKHNEASDIYSFRKSMVDKFGIRTDLSGPQRIDLLFDISCNLACRNCGPGVSTYWQKHLRDNNIQLPSIYNDKTKTDEVLELLKTMDLSNLEMVQFCGGETLMGNNYWRVASAIADMVPNAKQQLTMSFQTNGTQPIDQRYYELIERFHLVTINVSIDGIGDHFEYLRWPASWSQVTDNILKLKETVPVNVMFLVEETFSALNLFYHNEVEQWVNTNFATNRLGDVINHSKHLVRHDLFDVDNITKEYYNALPNNIKHLVSDNWQENPNKIKQLINDIEFNDNLRNQNWRKTFPEVAEFYYRYLR